MKRIISCLIVSLVLIPVADAAQAQVPIPRVLGPDAVNLIREAQLHEWPPFLHWDLREFPGCRVPWALAPNPVPDLDGNGTPNTAADRALAGAEFGASFATWEAVAPALIGFVNAAAPPAPGGIAMDGHNTIGFGDGARDDVQVVPVGGAVAAGDTLVTAGPNGILESQPGGDDIVNGTAIVDGGNLMSESFANTYGSVVGALAMTGIFFNNSSGVIIESDIVFDPGFTWLVNPATNNCALNRFNLRGTAVHEIGHFIGIAHPILANPAAADAADGVTPTMHAFACPAFDGNNFDQTLENADRDPCNFLYTPDLGDAPDPWMGVFNQYPTLVHDPGNGRVLNGVQLDGRAKGAEHVFGIKPVQPGRNYTYEWLSRGGVPGVSPECEANIVDLDPLDDGVTWYPNPPVWGRTLTVRAWIRYAADAHGNAHSYPVRPLFANAWLDINQNCIWEEHFMHVPVAVPPPALPNQILLTNAQGSIFLPPNVDPTKAVWLRVRLDHGEDVGQVANIDGTLNLDKGAAQFGEVEDYPLYCRRPRYEQHWLINPLPFPIPRIDLVVVGQPDPSDQTFSAAVDGNDCVQSLETVPPPVYELVADETFYRYPVPSLIPPFTFRHYGICRPAGGPPLTVLRSYFVDPDWPDDFLPTPDDVPETHRIPLVNVEYRLYGPGTPHYGNAKFSVGAVDILNGGWIDGPFPAGDWSDSLRVSVGYRTAPALVPLANLSPCDPLYASLPLVTVGDGTVTPEDPFEFDVPAADLAGAQAVIVEVESRWGANGAVNRQMLEFEMEEEATPIDDTPSFGAIALENYPNPFNPGTTIRYTLPEASLASLRVYDVAGRLVRTLFADRKVPAGTYEIDWDGRDEDGGEVASGVYFFRIDAGAHTFTRKGVLLK